MLSFLSSLLLKWTLCKQWEFYIGHYKTWTLSRRFMLDRSRCCRLSESSMSSFSLSRNDSAEDYSFFRILIRSSRSSRLFLQWSHSTAPGQAQAKLSTSLTTFSSNKALFARLRDSRNELRLFLSSSCMISSSCDESRFIEDRFSSLIWSSEQIWRKTSNMVCVQLRLDRRKYSILGAVLIESSSSRWTSAVELTPVIRSSFSIEFWAVRFIISSSRAMDSGPSSLFA